MLREHFCLSIGNECGRATADSRDCPDECPNAASQNDLWRHLPQGFQGRELRRELLSRSSPGEALTHLTEQLAHCEQPYDHRRCIEAVEHPVSVGKARDC